MLKDEKYITKTTVIFRWRK